MHDRYERAPYAGSFAVSFSRISSPAGDAIFHSATLRMGEGRTSGPCFRLVAAGRAAGCARICTAGPAWLGAGRWRGESRGQRLCFF